MPRFLLLGVVAVAVLAGCDSAAREAAAPSPVPVDSGDESPETMLAEPIEAAFRPIVWFSSPSKSVADIYRAPGVLKRTSRMGGGRS